MFLPCCQCRRLAITATMFLMFSRSMATISHRFATKTTYNNSFDDANAKPGTSQLQLFVDKDRLYQPVQVVGLYRHGIRYPGLDDSENALHVVDKLKSFGASMDVINQLSAVLEKLPMNKAYNLSATGAQELHGLGYRLGKAFDHMFSDSAREDIDFVVSNTERTIDSCSNFQKGFNEVHQSINVSGHKVDDKLLRFFKYCPKYTASVKNNKTAQKEYYSFQRNVTPIINDQLARNLGLANLSMTSDELTVIYKISAHELAVLNTKHWEHLLSLESLQLLEYMADLKKYWTSGFGYPINYQQSCKLVADMFHHMDAVVQQREFKKGIFYFGHAETILPVTSLFGLFKDGTDLRADNYEDLKHHRKFRTSIISPFSTNLNLVLYDCGNCNTGGDHGDHSSRYKVQILFKETPIRLPESAHLHRNHSGLYSYDELRNHFHEYIDSCQYDSLCQG